VHHRTYRLGGGRDARAVLDLVTGAVEELRDAAPGPVTAVGVGLPALIDPATGVARGSNHLDLVDVPMRDLLAERLGLPVVIDNDANAAVVAEWRFGAARGASHAVLLTLGTGIGGGVIIDGRVLRGARGGGAELGHVLVDADGPKCPGHCPNFGCLEALVSGPALGREGDRLARSRPDSALGRALASGRVVSGPLVTELAHDGDETSRELLRLMGRRLGLGIVTLCNVFDPEVVVVGGGVIAAGELLLEPARAVVAERALPPRAHEVRVVAAAFGAEAGMVGAAALALAPDAVGV
jgi:glucokinase